MRFKVGRQTAAFHLKRYVESGQIFRSGSTRGAVYSVRPFEDSLDSSQLEILLVKNLKELNPALVIEEVEARLPFKKLVSHNVRSLFSYALTAVLANAVDHSEAERIWIRTRIQDGILSFSVEDKGVGVFAKVKNGFHLQDEFEAAHHLMKGKQSTTPASRQGQGLFLVSRIADRFVITSHKLKALIDNDQEDFMLLESRQRNGTRIDFSIRARSKQNLQKILQEYANENLEIEQSQVRVRMLGSQLMSRVQAQKLVAGLESFERIVFDFKKVEGIGEAFAREVFAVFQKKHPQIKLEAINANLAIQFMIARIL